MGSGIGQGYDSGVVPTGMGGAKDQTPFHTLAKSSAFPELGKRELANLPGPPSGSTSPAAPPTQNFAAQNDAAIKSFESGLTPGVVGGGLSYNLADVPGLVNAGGSPFQAPGGKMGGSALSSPGSTNAPPPPGQTAPNSPGLDYQGFRQPGVNIPYFATRALAAPFQPADGGPGGPFNTPGSGGGHPGGGI